MDSFDRDSVTEFMTEPRTPDSRRLSDSGGGGGVGGGSVPPSPSTPSSFVTKGDRQRSTLPEEARLVSLLPGEHIQGVARHVTYLHPEGSSSAKGHLSVTNYKLHFRSTDRSPPLVIEIPLTLMNRIEKVGGQSSKGEHSYGLELFCKDIRTLKFALKQDHHSRREVIDLIQTYAFPRSNKLPLFCFDYREKFLVDGWSVYDPLAELGRMGVPNESWKVCRLNEQYSLCDTYPKLFAVPVEMTDDDLKAVAGFRCKGRLPVLSWIHPQTQAVIVRCAQPSVGMAGRRCSQDEKYAQVIADTNPYTNRITICDARPLTNAIANKAKGGGYETEEIYQNAEVLFFEIHNIHVMRDSLRKLREVCYPTVDEYKWLSNVDSTNWLRHIKCVLGSACRIVDKLDSHHISVLVHCSDGWDRTAQLTSLAMLLLDPYYRTIKGFEVLIEKEWISFGHKFQLRIGHGDENYADDNRSPIFLQFLDCVWQVMSQFPNAFQFNQEILITILDHLYSCRFGTFLSNCEKERESERVRENTVSLWSYIASKGDEFVNPLYLRQTSPLAPVASLRHIRPWAQVYTRHAPSFIPQDPKYLPIAEHQEMKDHLERLSRDCRKGKDKASADTTPVRSYSSTRN